MKEKSNFVKREIKDIIFTKAIASKENLPEIYTALFQKKNDDLNPNEFIETSIDTLFTNHIINDLSFLRKDKNEMIFVEAVSSWNDRNLIQFSNYILSVLAHTADHIEGFNPVTVKVDFFILYTGNGGPKKKLLHLRSVINPGNLMFKFLEFNIISKRNDNVPKGTIIEEYYRFCELQKEIFDKYGRNKKSFKILIRECIKKNILTDFFENNREEIMSNLNHFYNQERVFNDYVKQEIAKGKAEGIAIGKEEGISIGKEEGIAIGEAKGTTEAEKRIYNELIEKGYPKDEIYKLIFKK